MDKIAIINVAEWKWVSDFKTDITNAIKDSVLAIGKWIALGIVDNSLWICLTLAMGGIVFYIAGYKKGAKVATVSFIVFILLQLMGSVIR